MTSPVKPWEKVGNMSSVNDSMCESNMNKCDFAANGEPTLFSSEKICTTIPKISSLPVNAEPSIGRVMNPQRPEIPPRNYFTNNMNTVANTGYNNPYNRLGYPSQRMPYGGYSMYGCGSTPYYASGGYGGYGMNYNGVMSNPESRFIRAAEESTRPTFQAIESLTRAINSIAFMMESTFGSLNMSFQAVLSVIENFSQARTFLKQFITSILTLRIFHRFFSILVGLLRRMNLISEQNFANLLWQNVESQQLQTSGASGVSMWPVFTFLGLMFGAPYFISKMLPTENKSKPEIEWNPAVDRHVPLIAVHDFHAGTEQEISFQRGQRLKMMPTEMSRSVSQYWVYAANENNETGFIPRNHVAPA